MKSTPISQPVAIIMCVMRRSKTTDSIILDLGDQDVWCCCPKQRQCKGAGFHSCLSSRGCVCRKMKINVELTYVCGYADPFDSNEPEMHCGENLKSLLPRRHE